jgi:MFS family permease
MSTTAAPRPMTPEEKKVIFASSLGTVFEWYDFYLYGSLATIITKQFFSGLDETSAFIFALLAFAAGFIVRPFGALILRPPGRHDRAQVHVPGHHPDHGRVDLHRRPAAHLRQHRRGGADHPDHLRLLQGLALGGEYGGAATYVAEHAPHGKRGAYTAWIQTTATLGLFLSLLVILGTRTNWARPPSPTGAGAFRSCCRARCWRCRCGSACA